MTAADVPTPMTRLTIVSNEGARPSRYPASAIRAPIGWSIASDSKPPPRFVARKSAAVGSDFVGAITDTGTPSVNDPVGRPIGTAYHERLDPSVPR